MKKRYKILIGVVVTLLVIVIGASFYMLSYSLSPESRSKQQQLGRLYKRAPMVKSWVDSIMSHGDLRDTVITLDDGTKRHGYYMAAQHDTTATAVLVHGYKDCALSMLHIGYMYHHDMGYNILLPDLWAHGESEGDYIGMGWQERREVLKWVTVADSLFRHEAQHTSMVLHGISMGAATVMNVSGEDDVPAFVKAFVEDCGYTSAWDEFSTQLDEQFGLPAFPLMYTTSALCKVRYGWTFGECSPVDQVKKCKRPMLFIHGDNDTFVPTAMVHEVYAAHPGPKQLWLAAGSEHALAYSDHQQEYTATVRAFLNEYIK